MCDDGGEDCDVLARSAALTKKYKDAQAICREDAYAWGRMGLMS